MKFLSLVVFVPLLAITAKAVEFADPVRMQGGTEPVRVERPGYACPCWADIDGDGKKDLLVGQFNGGKIRVFKNRGDGQLNSGDWLQAGGKVAEVPGVWWCTSSTPQFVDLNGDGFRDILSGSYSRNEQPMAGLFQVLWGQSDGTFKAAEALKGTDDKPLLIPLGTKKDAWIDCICTRPTAVDWDGDGNLDLITGNFTGTFYLFMGEGKGKFQPKGELITTENGPLKIRGNHSDPFMIDWDHDGDLDLLSGSSEGGVDWSENSAAPGKPPKLNPFKSLIDPIVAVQHGERLSEVDLKGPTHATRIWVDDVNSDGKLDILVGDSVTLVEPAKGLTDEEFKAKSAEWQKELDAAIADMNYPATDENKAADENKGKDEDKKTDVDKKADEDKRAKAQERIQELYSKRSSFIKEDMTGFVWLYLQK